MCKGKTEEPAEKSVQLKRIIRFYSRTLIFYCWDIMVKKAMITTDLKSLHYMVLLIKRCLGVWY